MSPATLSWRLDLRRQLERFRRDSVLRIVTRPLGVRRALLRSCTLWPVCRNSTVNRSSNAGARGLFPDVFGD